MKYGYITFKGIVLSNQDVDEYNRLTDRIDVATAAGYDADDLKNYKHKIINQ